jgi:biopolymer transport protein ExbD/biopolymer transport protein TolR
MLQSWRKPAKLFSDFNTLQFASVMSLVVFVLLLMFLTIPTVFHSGSVDLPKVLHPVFMPGANREDAMIVNITRDGKLYFGSEQVTTATLRERMADHLKDHSVERKVYIKADMRARWGAVKQVVDSVRMVGLMRIAFLVDQRHSVALHM